QLNLDINKSYTIKYIYDKLDKNKIELMFNYTNEILKLFGSKVFKKNKDAISKNAYYSYLYARNVIKDRFEKGEEAISKDAQYSY
ncbi:MAG: hypothetical protein GTN36_02790, partial [Candidatus Aenigmarchaeota archaeon]|nr:hypothetical protein [Candidatus Aenigmarchaeota archaeon]